MISPNLQTISQGLETLSILELEELMQQILRVRKQKMSTVLSQVESELLRKINAALPKSIEKRYHFLSKKRYAEMLTEIEYAELLELTAFQEAHTSKRLGYLVELAKLRNQSLDEVLVALQIKPRVYVID